VIKHPVKINQKIIIPVIREIINQVIQVVTLEVLVILVVTREVLVIPVETQEVILLQEVVLN
jgi:hypothetical protein